ncbi:hypothetical protein DL98DRAFT_654697 [Cadophora sp. DSE1049]|nr:hypothetical protein DL98DRAFT_654697 [Cadophora sp. DSE1049]
MLALGVAVASSGPDDPEKQQQRFQALYQESDGDELVTIAQHHLENSGIILKDSWSKYLEEEKINKNKIADFVFEPVGDDVFAEFVTHIQSSVENWKSRKHVLGKAHNYFFSCCETLSNHSNFFSIIPTQNQYCSLFCGVLKTLVKAGANHVELGKKLDETITSINEQVKLCRLDQSLMQTKDISALIMQLYTHVFKLLSLILRHFTSRRARFFNAINENSFQIKFGDHVREITNTTDRIRKRAELGSRAEIRDMNLSVRYSLSKLDRKIDRTYEGMKEIRAQQEEQMKWLTAAVQELGQSGQKFLIQSHVPEYSEIQISETERLVAGFRCDIPTTLLMLPTPPVHDAGTRSVDTVESWPGSIQSVETELLRPKDTAASTIRDDAQSIENLLLRNPLPHFNDAQPQNPGIIPEPAVMTALQSWTNGQGPRILWVDGKNGNKHRASFNNLAEVVMTNAEDFEVGALYFSCDPYADEYENDGDDTAKHQQCLLDLVYVFIWQILQTIPGDVKLSGNFTETRFKTCTGAYDSLPAAVDILGDLLDVSPHISIIVIDGIENLSNTVIEPDIKYVLGLLFQHCGNRKEVNQAAGDVDGRLAGAGTGIRMLLTTISACQALAELYQEFEDGVAYVSVYWKRWHQYGLDADLFEG